MNQPQPNNPLHGITLQTMLEHLVEHHGWDDLAVRIQIRCFSLDPSIKSSLKFLRKTPWARAQVEDLYLAYLRRAERNRDRNARRAAQRKQTKDGVAGGTPDDADGCSPGQE